MLNFFYSRTSGFGVAIIIVLIANYLGRTLSLTISHTILGVACIGLAFIPPENTYAVLVVYILASIVASVSKLDYFVIVKIVDYSQFIYSILVNLCNC